MYMWILAYGKIYFTFFFSSLGSIFGEVYPNRFYVHILHYEWNLSSQALGCYVCLVSLCLLQHCKMFTPMFSGGVQLDKEIIWFLHSFVHGIN